MDETRLVDEGFPSVGTGVGNGVVSIEDAAREEVLVEELPDIFLSVEFRAVGRQLKRTEMPSVSINTKNMILGNIMKSLGTLDFIFSEVKFVGNILVLRKNGMV